MKFGWRVLSMGRHRRRGAILSWRFSFALVSIALACGQPGGEGADLAMPSKESLGLSERQLARYSALSMDELVEAMGRFAENEEESQGAREAFIKLHGGHWVGWAGTVRGSRVVRLGERLVEISVAVAPPSRSRSLFAATVPILFEVPPGHPVTELGKGNVIRFAGRLEFDGRTRKPWVLDAHLLEATGEP